MPTVDPVARVHVPSTVVPVSLHHRERRFQVWMAYACALVAFAGFTPTYWAPVAAGAFDGPPLLHLHGLLSSSWMVIFIVQARLAASGRLERHGMVGFAGISLATAMFFAGLMVVAHSIEAAEARGSGEAARTFAIVPFTIVVGFAVLVALAVASVRRPDIHMRLMLVATISILPPAIARILFVFLAPEGATRPGAGDPPPLPLTLVPSFAANLLLVVAIAYDWRTRGRPHPAYLIAGSALLIVQVARVPLGTTAVWHAMTDWLLRLVG